MNHTETLLPTPTEPREYNILAANREEGRRELERALADPQWDPTLERDMLMHLCKYSDGLIVHSMLFMLVRSGRVDFSWKPYGGATLIEELYHDIFLNDRKDAFQVLVAKFRDLMKKTPCDMMVHAIDRNAIRIAKSLTENFPADFHEFISYNLIIDAIDASRQKIVEILFETVSGSFTPFACDEILMRASNTTLRLYHSVLNQPVILIAQYNKAKEHKKRFREEERRIVEDADADTGKKKHAGDNGE